MQFYLMENDNFGQNALVIFFYSFTRWKPKSLFWRECTRIMQFHLLETDNVGQNAVLGLLWRECTRIMQFYPMETDNIGQNALLICFLEVCKPQLF